MSVRFSVLAAVISALALGCATDQSESAGETSRWRAQKQRQQQIAREAGRIGYIGNEAPHL